MNLCSFTTFSSEKVFIIIHLSPHIYIYYIREESKTVLDSGFHAVDSGLQVMDSGLFVSETWIPNSDC